MTTGHENALTREEPSRARNTNKNKQSQYSKTGGQVHYTNIAAPLLSRLDRVRPAGAGRWTARCPAHDDRSPSLSIHDTGERALIHCFGGCDPTDILAAVGLQWSDLYPDKWDCAAKRPNEGARRYARRILAATDPLDIERLVLRVAAADRKAGRPESVEDRARVQLAIERLRAAGGA